MTRRQQKLSPITWATAHAEAVPAGWHVAMPQPVSANRIWRHGKGRTFQAKQHTTDKAEAARRFGHLPPLVGPVAVRICWVRARRSGDLDNFSAKPVLDILKGVLFGDDSDVVEIRMLRFEWAESGRAPGVYVWVFAADEPLIWGGGMTRFMTFPIDLESPIHRAGWTVEPFAVVRLRTVLDRCRTLAEDAWEDGHTARAIHRATRVLTLERRLAQLRDTLSPHVFHGPLEHPHRAMWGREQAWAAAVQDGLVTMVDRMKRQQAEATA